MLYNSGAATHWLLWLWPGAALSRGRRNLYAYCKQR